VNFVHYDLGQLSGGQVATVQVRERANVMLMDQNNFTRYHRQQRCTFHGAQALTSPVELPVPHAGHWHAVLDLGGAAGVIHSNLTLS
jgi:hypothetical protein